MQYRKTSDIVISGFEDKLHKDISWTLIHLSPISGTWHRDEDMEELFIVF